MKKVFILMMIVCLLAGCSSNSSTKVDSDDSTNVVEKTDKEQIIIDVRTKEEYEELHVVGAINIPLDQISDAKIDKNVKILVYCKSGKRSAQAYKVLKDKGYDVEDLGSINDIDLDKE